MDLPESALWLWPYMASWEPKETSSLRIIQGQYCQYNAAVGLGTIKAKSLHLPIFPNTHSSRRMENVWDNVTVL